MMFRLNNYIKNIIGKYTLPKKEIINKNYKKCLKSITCQYLYFYLNRNSILKKFNIHSCDCVCIIYKFKSLENIDINRLEKLYWYITSIDRINKTVSLHIETKNLNLQDKITVNKLIKKEEIKNKYYNNENKSNIKLNVFVLIGSLFLLYKFF